MLTGSPSRWVEAINVAVTPTKVDLLLVGNFLKTEVVDRTSRGVDAEGRAFAPYSTKSPVYWNPSTAGRKAKWDQRAKAVDRMAKKLGAGRGGVIRDANGRALGHRHGDSIKFASYAAFKQALGRAGVDLTGPRAPHMMQALTVRAAEDDKGVILGIYGEPAGRAHGHQYGNPKRGLPQRKFLGATAEDRLAIIKLLRAQMWGRMAKRRGRGY